MPARAPATITSSSSFHPLEKKREHEGDDADEDDEGWWYPRWLCRKQSSDILGGDIATVTDEADCVPESGGDPVNADKTEPIKKGGD